MFRQIGSHVGVAVHFFGVLSLLSESVQTKRKQTNALERKATLNFWFGRKLHMATQRKHGDSLRYLQKISHRQGEAPC